MLYPATCVRLRYGPHESWMIAGFLGGPDGTLLANPRGDCHTIGFRLAARALLCRVITPSAFNRLFRQAAVPGGPRHRVSSHAGAGILTGRPSPCASRLRLRTRLTLARHASARKPWPYGGEETLLPYRYLYLHLLFQSLQKGSSPCIRRHWNAPLPTLMDPVSSAGRLYPIIIHAGPLD